MIRIGRSKYPQIKFSTKEQEYCYSNCTKYKVSGAVEYSNYFNSLNIYETYNVVYQGDVYTPVNDQKLTFIE